MPRMANERRLLVVGVDPRPRLLARPGREAEVVDMRVREHDGLEVADPPLARLDPVLELVPGGGQAGVDRGQPLAVLDQVPVDDPVGLESVYAVGQLFSVHAGRATRAAG